MPSENHGPPLHEAKRQMLCFLRRVEMAAKLWLISHSFFIFVYGLLPCNVCFTASILIPKLVRCDSWNSFYIALHVRHCFSLFIAIKISVSRYCALITFLRLKTWICNLGKRSRLRHCCLRCLSFNSSGPDYFLLFSVLFLSRLFLIAF